MREPIKDKDALRRRTAAVAREMFFKKGIKAVTMDDVAHELRMSKRTLYMLFADKEELLIACHDQMVKEHDEQQNQICSETDSVIEIILKGVEATINCLQSFYPAFMHDVRKYPRLVKVIEQMRKEREDTAVEFLQRGVDQGFLREDVNYHIFYRMVFLQSDYIDTNKGIFDPATPAEVFLSTFFTYLRGCATAEGWRILDDFLQRYKQEHDIS